MPMIKVMPITEQFQKFVPELQKSFSVDLLSRTRQARKQFVELDSERSRDRFAAALVYRRGPAKGGAWRPR